MRRLLLALGVLLVFAAPAMAQYYVCSPVTIVDPEGRPIRGGTFQVRNSSGTIITTYSSSGGGVVSSPQSPGAVPGTAPAILTFFAPPGAYTVSVSGGGISRDYPVNCSAPIASSTPAAAVVSQSRGAATFNRNLAPSGPPLICPLSGAPCYLAFAGGNGAEQLIETDFTTPSVELAFTGAAIEWAPSTTSTGGVTFAITYCVYQLGDVPCIVDFNDLARTFVFTDTAPGSVSQTLFYDIGTSSWNVNWPANSHVVIVLKRVRTDGNNTYPNDALFKNLRLEWTR